MEGSDIIVSVVMDREPNEEDTDRISVAATEIMADYPQATIVREKVTVSRNELPRENIVTGGVIFERAEGEYNV